MINKYIEFVKNTITRLLVTVQQHEKTGSLPEKYWDHEEYAIGHIIDSLLRISAFIAILEEKYVFLFISDDLHIFRPDGTQFEWWELDAFHLPPGIERIPYTFAVVGWHGGEAGQPEAA